MKRFWQGFGVAVVLIVVAAVFVLPQYSDYRARAESAAMLGELKQFQKAVEAKALASGSLSVAGEGLSATVPPGSTLREVIVSAAGVIVAKGGSKGQVLVLVPVLSQGKVEWQCRGGGDRDVPRACR